MTDDIADILRAARKKRGLTQKQAAALAGLTQPQLSMIENGVRSVSAKTARELCRIYQMDADVFNNIFSLDEGNLASLAVACLKTLAEKSGEDRIIQSTEIYVALTAYIYIRELYLANPYNTDKIFKLDAQDIKRIKTAIFSEPQKTAAKLNASNTAKAKNIEPTDEQAPEFLNMIRLCETAAKKYIADLLKIYETENK